nr:Gfo/Idh/MocA family oxidoreductase [Colwellia sp. C2M11]
MKKTSLPNRKINMAIIGSNFIVDTFLTAATEVEDFNFYAIYSRQQATGEAKALQYDYINDGKKVKVFTDLAVMLDDDNIDAVYIASPNSFHAKQAIQCLNAGKHVLGEKPSASNSKELSEILSAAIENNCCFMEALMSLHLPNFSLVKQHIYRIGKPRKYFGQYCQYSSRYSLALDSLAKNKLTPDKPSQIPNTFLPEFANGALIDIGIYPLYPVVALWGEPDTISAQGVKLETGVDGAGDLQLNYGDKIANISYSKISNGENFVEFQGELGRLRIEFVALMSKVELFLNNGSYELLSMNKGTNSDKGVIENHQPMSYEISHFIELVQAHKHLNKPVKTVNIDALQSPVTTWELSRQVISIIDQARKKIGVIYPND